ncbi:MAG: TrkA family potassium uptake protein [Ilumatobacteraceae bacterium]|jgi:trk system potassium uptake protein TrkA|nr:TrkA family potassium uptake protein [Ilumatobacteraceae bacterium]
MSKVLIVGGGRIGAAIGVVLLGGGHDVRLLETDAGRVDELARTAPGLTVVTGSGTDPEVLEAAGARQADTVVAVTSRDETNLVVTCLAKFEFGVSRTIARVNDPGNAWLYTADMGVDVALDQADIIGHLVAEEMSLGEMTLLLKLRRGRYALVEERVHPASTAAGRPVAALDLPAECVLVAIIRDAGIVMPHGATELHADDEVLAVVRADHASRLAELLGPVR